MQLKDLLPSMQLKLKKRAIATNTPLINSSHYQFKYLDVYANRSMCSYTIMPMPFGAWKGQRALLFLPWLLFFDWKNFNHITKDANIFHLKSSSSHRPSYFSTSTRSKHTSHLHNQPIASGWFLTWRNMAKILQMIIFDMEKFWHLIWANSTSCKFSLFLFLIPLYIFQIYGVIMN